MDKVKKVCCKCKNDLKHDMAEPERITGARTEVLGDNSIKLVLTSNPIPFTDCRKSRFDKTEIKDVIFNNPATIVKWSDGTKTVVKCQECDTYNPEIGLAMCIIKHMCGNKSNYNDIFAKWLSRED